MSVLEAAHQKAHGTSDKYLHYYDAYEFHFSSLKNAEITLLEIGVQDGGSLWTWRKYFATAGSSGSISILNARNMQEIGSGSSSGINATRRS